MSDYKPKIDLTTTTHEGDREVARFSIDYEVRHNILTSEMMLQLTDMLERQAKNEKLQAIVITGAGESAFVGGSDINEKAGLDAESARDYIKKVHHMCSAVRQSPVPVIARIGGFCLNEGLLLAASCDMRVCSDHSRFGMPEVRLGIPAVAEAAILPRILGWGKTRELIFTGEMLNAYDALSFGLVERVAPMARLDETVDEALETILRSNPRGLRLQKQLMNKWDSLPLDSAIEEGIGYFSAAYESGEPQKNVNQFLENIRKKREAKQAQAEASQSPEESHRLPFTTEGDSTMVID